MSLENSLDAVGFASGGQDLSVSGLESMVAAAPSAVAMLDTRLRYLCCSERWLSDFGLQGQSLSQRSHYDVFPNLPERWKVVHLRGLAGFSESVDDDFFVDPTGKQIWLNWRVVPWRTASGQIGGIVIFAEDITALKKASYALRLSHERLFELNRQLEKRAWLDQQALAALDFKFKNLGPQDETAAKFQSGLDLLRDLVLGERSNLQRWLGAFLLAGGRLAIAAYLVPFIGYSPVLTIVASILTMLYSGPIIGVAVSLALVLLSDYFYIQPLGYLFNTRVSIEQFILVLLIHLALGGLFFVVKDSFRLSMWARRQAENANLTKDRFLAAMSHEIRTPLSAILGFAELLSQTHLNERERAKYHEVVRRNGELLLMVINDILDFSKIEGGYLDIVKHPVVVKDVIDDVVVIMESKALAKKLKLTVQIASDVPLMIRTDALRLRQILINLIGNAIKFTDSGSVDLSVRNTPSDQGLWLAFQITDTGPGIDESEVPRLFKPFSRLASSKLRSEGTGLGLSIAKKLSQLLGGDLSLSFSQKNRGSTFTLIVDPDLASFNCPSPTKESLVAKKTDGMEAIRHLSVLVADDSPDNQELVALILESAGVREIVFAANGEDAVREASGRHFDVVLMDLQMPIMDGWQATSRLRELNFAGKIIAFTAHALIQEKELCLAKGFDGYLSKPFDCRTLVETLGQFAPV